MRARPRAGSSWKGPRSSARRSGRRGDRIGVRRPRARAGAGASCEPGCEQACAAGTRVLRARAGRAGRVADTVTPQPVVAIVRPVDVPCDQLQSGPQPIWSWSASTSATPAMPAPSCAAPRRPAPAAVVCCDGSVDVYNPKTVRASAGVLFHVPVVAGGDAAGGADAARGMGPAPLGRQSPAASASYTEVDLARPAALVLGNEAHGLADPVVGSASTDPDASRWRGPASRSTWGWPPPCCASRPPASGAGRGGRGEPGVTKPRPDLVDLLPDAVMQLDAGAPHHRRATPPPAV